MKKSLLLLAGALSLGSLNAQTTEEQTTKFRDNWSIGLNGGIVTPLSHSAFFKNARATMGIDLNKQLSPIYGLTFENMWSINTFESSAAFDASNLMLLHRINLNNVFCRYKGKPSLFEVEALAGFGWLHVNDAYYTNDGEKDGDWISSKVGLNLNFNLGEKKAWTIAVKPAILWNVTQFGEDNINFHSDQAAWEITAGVVYHFKNSNGKHHMTKVRAYDASEVSALNATINNLRQDVNSKDESMRNTANKLRNEEQKSADLERALKECQNQGPKVITNNKKTLESVVTFRQGKIVIDASQQPNVERIATYLKNHKEAKVNILGYASPEGSAEVNERIANQRAEAVKNMLVNKYRIDARRITAKGQGVGYMFEEPDWNRVSICTIVED